MIKLYNKIDDTILKKHPFQWIIGWNKFLPIIAILLLFSIAIGFMLPTTTYNYYNNKGLNTAAIFLGFVSFMVFILYVIRQIKFNSFRIHHHIPFAKSILVFFSFWILITLLTSIPFIPHHIHNWRVTKKINSITDDFKSDTKILYEGSVFFVSDYNNHHVKQILDDDTDETKQHFEVEFNNSFITINNIDHQFGYFHQYADESFRLPITISREEALNRINKFIKVASKYDIELTEYNAEEIYNKRKSFNQGKSNDYNFSLFKIKETNDTTFYSAVNKYDGMMYSYQRHYNKDFDFELMLGILMFSIVLAILLWIVISIPMADFGYSVLVSVVLMVFMGIISALINLLTSNDFIIRLAFYIAIFIVYFFAFIIKKDTQLHRVLKIVSHYLVAVFLFLLFLEIDEANIFHHRDEFYVFSTLFLIGIIMSVFLFKQVYKNYRLLPR